MKLEEIAEMFKKQAALKRYEMGEIICAAGDPSNFVYLIKEGRVRACHFAKNGSSITLLYHDKGEFIGVGGAIDQRERAVYYMASENGCTLWQIPAVEFIDLMKKEALLSYEVALSLAKRQRALDTQILRQVSIRANDRLAVVLFDLAMKAPSKENGTIKIHITQQDLSDILGTCRQTTTSMISKLKDEGVVDTKKGYIVVKDLAELQRRAIQIDS